jgi:hypothetical protein
MAKKSLASLMKNAPNVSKKANELLHNRFILYFVFIIAVANLFHFVFSHDLMSVCVFIVAGLLTSFFSKNMVVIMVISIVVTHVVRFGNGGYEGFESLEEQVKEILDEEGEDDEKEGFKRRRRRRRRKQPGPEEFTYYRENGNEIITFREYNENCGNEKCYIKVRGKKYPIRGHGPSGAIRPIPTPLITKDGKEITTFADLKKYCLKGGCTAKKSSTKSSTNSSGVNEDAIQKMVEEIAEEKVNEIVNEQIRV